MMISSYPILQQDTLKVNKVILNDSVKLKADSSSAVRKLTSKDTLKHILVRIPKPTVTVPVDTTLVCRRNSINDVTFYDSTNFIRTLKQSPGNRFLYIISEQNKIKQEKERAILVKHLKPGIALPPQPLHADWIILIILISAVFYSLLRSTSKTIIPGVARFFMFRGINDPASRDTGGLFHWQSTILNLVSFIIISLFVYCAAAFYDFIPSHLPGMIFWLISLGIIIAAVTLRHFVCVITGSISGQRDVFREYLVGIYQSYRFSAIILLFIVIFLTYTFFLPAKVYFISGIVILILMYLIRVIRLLIIFINRNISVFYLILYLCALEILPVVISIKYFTGLV